MEKSEEMPISISEDDVRAGVTGHHVRYVLAFGLAGVIVAFAAIGVYFGYHSLAQALHRAPTTVMPDIVLYAPIIVLGALGAVFLLELWNLVAGRGRNTSQIGMRIRVVVQFIVICVAMALLYLHIR
jgi:uncharacterized membrane protein